MQSALNRDTSAIHEQNISYYNAIAANYDIQLDQENSNKIVREKVAEKFQQIVQSGEILDFGGGTGQDLKWLINKGYRILFCEPSEGMRDKAVELNKNLLHYPNLIFIEKGREDFTKWDKQMPFSQKVDAILANFAVLNCIPDIGLLFRNLALVLRPGGSLIAVVLRPKFSHVLRSFAGLSQETLNITYRGHRQTVYIHPVKEIRKASAFYYYFSSWISLHGSGFLLIHLTRKDK
jgi:SAM-dependent methyltransferase